jgi:hypothetical protein
MKVPVLGSLVTFMGAASNPRLNFIVFRGLGQQGVKSLLILQTLSRSLFWFLVLWILNNYGYISTILSEVAAGLGTSADFVLVIALCLIFVLISHGVPASLGLIIGSLDRRAGRGLNTDLPQTGYENFITRRKPAKPWGRST